MGKQKQQVISRFFATKPKDEPPRPPARPPLSPPKISGAASFSPSKRLRATTLSPNNRISKLSPTHTPLEQQVLELKSNYPDVLLMVEVGYKYRFFGPDAETASRVLGIFCHVDHNLLTASIPTFRLNVHVRRLVSAGYKVGVVKQTETAALKAHGRNKSGPFTRSLSALYSKATLEAVEALGGVGEECGCDNYLVCVVENEGNDDHVRIGYVGVEVSTGDVLFGEFEDGFMREALQGVISTLSPQELLLGSPLSNHTEKVTSSSVQLMGPCSSP